jgi:uncharacterized protein YchJ
MSEEKKRVKAVVEDKSEEEIKIENELKEKEKKIKELEDTIRKEIIKQHSRRNYYSFLRSGCKGIRQCKKFSSFSESIPNNVKGATSGKKRNKDCSCGSGKKYKKCCLMEHRNKQEQRACNRKED